MNSASVMIESKTEAETRFWVKDKDIYSTNFFIGTTLGQCLNPLSYSPQHLDAASHSHRDTCSAMPLDWQNHVLSYQNQ